MEITLPDGRAIILRPVTALDRQRILAGFEQLSPLSRRFRFFTPIKAIRESDLASIIAADQQNHVAWIALDPRLPGNPGVGLGRFVRLPNNPQIADAAFVVVDGWQHQGVGTRLLAALYLRALELGITTLQAEVLPENVYAAKWLRELGASGTFEGGINRFFLPVLSLERLENRPSVRRFFQRVRELAVRRHPTQEQTS
jgi:GNAT superfamily N-acetyltransferase